MFTVTDIAAEKLKSILEEEGQPEAALRIDGDAGDRLARARGILAPGDGISAWSVGDTGKLLARIVARDGHALRRRLVPLLRLLTGEAGLPKIWSS
jgi:urease accessory protein